MLTDIAMQEADLYLTKVDICRYWPKDVGLSCKDFMDRRAAGKDSIEDYAFLTPRQMHSFKLALEANPWKQVFSL
jgi:hypothetical protein